MVLIINLNLYDNVVSFSCLSLTIINISINVILGVYKITWFEGELLKYIEDQ